MSTLKEKVNIEDLIKSLEKGFGSSDEDQAKTLQLFKGLIFSGDPKAKEYLKKLDKATTDISKSMSERKEESSDDPKANEFMKKINAFTSSLSKEMSGEKKEGAELTCPNCGDNLGKASEVVDEKGKAWCGNCGTSFLAESSEINTITAKETFRIPGTDQIVEAGQEIRVLDELI